jgi:hypothetical protein
MSAELWGIDDPQEVQRIKRAVNERTRSYFRPFIYFGVFGALAVAVWNLLSPYYPVFAGIAMLAMFFVGVLIWSAGEFSRYLRVKAEVLESMGRCANCGYKLEPRASSCPECGQPKNPAAKGPHSNEAR